MDSAVCLLLSGIFNLYPNSDDLINKQANLSEAAQIYNGFTDSNNKAIVLQSIAKFYCPLSIG